MKIKIILAPLMLGIAMAASVPAVQARSVVKKAADPVKNVLMRASDSALDKLAMPGAFQNDPAIRIALPALAGNTGSAVLGVTDKLGLTDTLVKGLNDAAGVAAQEAKPIFRGAIDKFRISDAPGVLMKNDGGTRYLKKAAGADLKTRLRPLIVSALGKVGALDQFDRLGKAGALLGLTKDGLADSVTDQALSGIFSYIGNEEAALRRNPMGAVKSILGDVVK